MLRPTKAYYDYLKNPFKYLAPQPARKATPLDVINNIKPLPTTAYQLALHYQRIIDNKATNQSFVYYRITDAKQDDHLGMLDGGGRDIKKNLPKGPAKVYYGLTREDATVNGKAVIQKDHDQLVSQLQTQLDSIIAKVSTKAAKGNATLKNKNMFGKGWVYTEDFFKGLIDDAKDEIQSVEKHPLDAMVDSNPALANSSSAIDAAAQFAMDSWQSGDKAAILNYYQKQQADAKAQLYLGRLMTDPKCRELLYNFPKRYVQADSSTDAATMLGRFAPLLILALVTKGRSTELETSTELKTIIESIAGDKGTIERAAVQTMDEGDVESMSSQIDTLKGNIIEKRKILAKKFYLDSGFDLDEIPYHMQGIDFSVDVELVKINKGTRLYQWRINDSSQGSYYAKKIYQPSNLGINPYGRNFKTGKVEKKVLYKYKLTKDIKVLYTKARPVVDTWSVEDVPYKTIGEAMQVFTTDGSAMELDDE